MKPLRAPWVMLLLLTQVPVIAAEAQAGEAPKAGPGQIDEDSDYVIGAGDGLQIYGAGSAETTAALVLPDGKISVPPMVENLKAAGNTSTQLARLIEKQLAEFIRTPQVTVVVTSPQSALSKITVIGQVKEPKAIPYTQGITAMDVIMKVGGLGEFASGNRSKIVRKDASGKEQEIPVKLADLVKKAKISENVVMKPGDILLVPESKF